MKRPRTRILEISACEAGYRGHDRQPVKDHTGQSLDGVADERQAASPCQVFSWSRQAIVMYHGKHCHPDMIHPGPCREDGERSMGDAHHDQHEQEKEMRSEEL